MANSANPRPITPGYSGKPLAQKLGIAANQRAAFIAAPAEFTAWLGPLPDGATAFKRIVADLNFAILFGTDAAAVKSQFPKLTHNMAPGGMIWVSWPKKAAKVQTDLTEDIVREIGLATGWVDVKVCAVSDVWSGLKFLRRKSPSS